VELYRLAENSSLLCDLIDRHIDWLSIFYTDRWVVRYKDQYEETENLKLFEFGNFRRKCPIESLTQSKKHAVVSATLWKSHYQKPSNPKNFHYFWLVEASQIFLYFYLNSHWKRHQSTGRKFLPILGTLQKDL
jgi:hypothetical protein